MQDQKISLDKVTSTAQPNPNAAPGEVGYRPPVDSIPLPSRGKTYTHGSPLAGVDRIDIRSMTAREEDILTSRALLRQGRAITALLQSCIVDKRVEVDQMLLGDRNAAMIGIRISGYGAEYSAEVSCPHCEEEFKHNFDLSKLPVKPLEADPIAPGTNAFTFSLPDSKKEVIFKLMTGADDREIDVILERQRRVTGPGAIEQNVTTRLIHQIERIGDESDKAKIQAIVMNLPARDARALRQHIDEISPGVEMIQSLTCPSCSQEVEVDVPLGTEFLWPSGK